jgi:hypothetical protein
MAVIKIFECIKFRPDFSCSFTIAGEEGFVIEQAVTHEQVEHSIEDTPEIRKEITDSLIDDGSDT